jgi:hypothetical protein
VSFVTHDTYSNPLFVICLDTSVSARTALKQKLNIATTSFSFDWHAIFLEVVRDKYDKSV